MNRYEAMPDLGSAINDFRTARNRAILKEILARLTGESTELLSYEEVRQKLKMTGSADRGLHEIPLDAIVGSVGRYTDFTRDFLPRGSVNETRWARVREATNSLVGLPPIEVYQIGEAYFVKDGNHRVSVARLLGSTEIQAYVTEIHTRVPLTPDIRPDDLIVKAEYAEFLEKTHLDELRPEANLSVTVPGQYPVLEEHISVHRYFMGIDQKRPAAYPEAVADWYDSVYLPVVELIRAWGVLRDFPNRTEADLYLWIAEQRAALEKELGWQVRPEAAILELVEQMNPAEVSTISRIGGKLISALTPDKLEPGPPAGQWREESLAIHRDSRLFSDLLVPVNGKETGWYALGQSLLIAKREEAQLHGLHIVPSEEQKDSPTALAVQAEFNRRCIEAGVNGHLVIAVGEVAKAICSRARWTDLVITNLAYPPPPQPLAKLDYGFRDLILHCPRPLLIVPQTISPLDRALLAYDGSPKSQEALFLATYLAGRWQIALAVISIQDSGRVTDKTLENARKYLESHGVQATYLIESGPAAEKILKTAQDQQSNLLLMGGYGYTPVLEVVLGSAVDQVLRESHKPVLICR